MIGAVFGPLTQVRFVGSVLVAGGLAGGVVGVFDALEQGNVQLAAFRAASVYTGLRTFVRPTPEPYVFPASSPSPTGGRLGNGETRALNISIADYLRAKGWTIRGGGGGSEEYLPPLGGGRKGGNYLDITAERNGQTLRINTIDTLSDGMTPTAREAAAAALIQAKRPSDVLLLIPKNTSASEFASHLGN